MDRNKKVVESLPDKEDRQRDACARLFNAWRIVVGQCKVLQGKIINSEKTPWELRAKLAAAKTCAQEAHEKWLQAYAELDLLIDARVGIVTIPSAPSNVPHFHLRQQAYVS